MSEKSLKHRNHRSPWTLDEFQFVEKHHGNMPVSDIAAALGRSVNGVRRVVGLLGLRREHAGPWTEEEVAVLHAHYKKNDGIAHVQALLPHRTKAAIIAQASKQGITAGSRWSASERRFLEKHYGSMSTNKIAAILGRSVSGVRAAVNVFGYGKEQTGAWTEAEIAVLRTCYDRGAGLSHVQSLLPGRSRAAIAAQASKMNITGRRPWQPDEDRVLIAFYPELGSRVIDKLTHRTLPAIKHRAKFLGLKYHKRKPR